MSEREKAITIVFVFAQQLRTWLKHSRDLGYMNRQFKYLSGILLNAIENLLRYFFDGHSEEDDVVYEHSVGISDVVEKMVTLEEEDIRRVVGLIDKIKRDREINKCHQQHA